MARNKKSKFGSKVVADVDRREKAASSYGYLNLPKDLPVFKESEGTFKLDIIPYIVSNDMHPDANKELDIAMEGTEWYKRPIWVCSNIGPENESVISPKSNGKKCPVHDTRNAQFKEGVDEDEIIRKPQHRNLYVVIPIGHKKYDEDFHIWDISNYNFQELLDDELREDPDLANFPDPEEGMTLRVRFSEEKYEGRKYYKASRIDFLERKVAYSDKDVEEAPNLDELFDVPSYKELQNMLMGIEDEDYESDSSDDGPKPRSRRGKSLDEKEEEEEPKRRRRSDDKEDGPKRTRRGSKEEDDKEEDKSTRRRRRTDKEDKDEPEEECPEGFEFGKDWDDDPSCDKCKLFESCGQAYENMQ